MPREQEEPTTTTEPPEAAPKAPPRPRDAPSDPAKMPPWKVLLHNDDVNSMDYVVLTVVELTPLNRQVSLERTQEAHRKGLALLLTTHKERAELYQQQFTSKGLTVTIEPDEK